ncbi:unnamed protein product [Rhizophagus irregularis]|nr:unnamed protein product [Rhizophagus irregularis]
MNSVPEFIAILYSIIFDCTSHTCFSLTARKTKEIKKNIKDIVRIRFMAQKGRESRLDGEESCGSWLDKAKAEQAEKTQTVKHEKENA